MTSLSNSTKPLNVDTLGFTWYDEKHRVEHHTMRITWMVGQGGDTEAADILDNYKWHRVEALEAAQKHLDKTRTDRITSASIVYGD